MTLRAEAFADALDGTAIDLLDDTELMLGVAERLHGLPGTAALRNAGARPDFRSELRARLLAEAVAASTPEPHATVVPITSRWNQSWARRNRARLLTSAAAGVIIVTAVSVGASSSLPGNPLYPLKRGGESVEYALAGSDEARGQLELGFARTRLDEIGQLTSHDAAFGIAPLAGVQAAGGSTVLATSTNTWVVRLFGDMDHNANKGSALLQKSFKNHPRPAPLREVQEFAKYQEARLMVLRSRLAGSALTKATSSLSWAQAVVKSTTVALAKCTSTSCPAAVAAALTPPGTPSASAAAPSAVPSSASPSAVTPPSVVAPTTSPVPSAAATTTVTPAAPGTTPPPTTPVPATTPAPPTAPTATPTDTPQPTAGPPTSDGPTTTPAPPSTSTSPPTDTPSVGPTSPASPSTPAIPPSTPEPTTSAPPTPPAPTTNPPPATTPAPTTAAPTTAPATTPAPAPSTVPPTTVPPTTEPPTTVPPTTPAPTAVPTTPAPTAVPTTVPTAVPTTVPPTTVPPTTEPPTTVPPTTVPPTTEPPPTVPPTTVPPTTRPPLICLSPGHVINGFCIRPPGPPGRT